MDCDLWLEGLSKLFNGLVGQKNGQIIMKIIFTLLAIALTSCTLDYSGDWIIMEKDCDKYRCKYEVRDFKESGAFHHSFSFTTKAEEFTIGDTVKLLKKL
jgi:hypothetical protein